MRTELAQTLKGKSPLSLSSLGAADASSADAFLERIEFFRLDASRKLDPARRGEMGQFLTPLAVSRLMASMFVTHSARLRVLDAGAGVGTLAGAVVAEACRASERGVRPEEIHVTAYEVEPVLVQYLVTTLDECGALCRRHGISFTGEVRKEDFIRGGVGALQGRDLFPGDAPRFNSAILNPPYRKISSDSEARRLLASVGIETSNLYTAFLWLAALLLDDGGELVAITPRSFCNGPYFRPFRRVFTRLMSFTRVHAFGSRTHAFSDDDVLQENIIFHAAKTRQHENVLITSSAGPEDQDVIVRDVNCDQLVRPDDPGAFIHIVPDEIGDHIGRQMRHLGASLPDLRIEVSTGRVVEFRAKELLRDARAENTAPLIHPIHFAGGFIRWPAGNGRRANAIELRADTDDLLVPAGHYVLVKRFSAKEERRRIVAAVYDPGRVPAPTVAFENHLNYYHRDGRGLPPTLAFGLAAFLNSTIVDEYFRQFNGHTQVNAADLRSLRYPPAGCLSALGAKLGRQFPDHFPDQDELDELVWEELFSMAGQTNPTKGKKLVQHAVTILTSLGVPREQQNQRSALTLLALLDMKPKMSWAEAHNPLRGITEMMDYFRDHFGVRYAPNTRETVRRFTIHQFVQMGLVLANPDDPRRPVNSPDNRYQIEPSALVLIRTFGSADWDVSLQAYLATAAAIQRLHSRERHLPMIPVQLPDGRIIELTTGGQNVLVKGVLEKFCPRYTPGATVVYVGDAGAKFKVFEREYLQKLGVTIDEHGKMPDVVVHYTAKDWLVLIEAVTSHGPVNLKRHNELKHLFRESKAGLVFVTAFEARKAMVKYLSDIAWETEVWAAESPTHLIHFNGERFLGPYAG